MPTVTRSKFFHDKLHDGYSGKKNNRQKIASEIGQQLEIPRVFTKGSFEGHALKARIV